MTGAPPSPGAATTRPVPRARDPRPADGRGRTPLRRVGDATRSLIRGVRNLWAEARSGQRPLVVVLLVAIALGVVMLSGPFERYLAGRERVASLRAAEEALGTEIATLEREVDLLEDPATLEAIAREQQGMVRPGEVPYTVVPPEIDRPQITAPRSTGESPDPAWYERAWIAVRGLF